MEVFKIMVIVAIWVGVWNILLITVHKLSRYIYKDDSDYIRVILYILLIIIAIVVAKLTGIRLG